MAHGWELSTRQRESYCAYWIEAICRPTFKFRDGTYQVQYCGSCSPIPAQPNDRDRVMDHRNSPNYVARLRMVDALLRQSRSDLAHDQDGLADCNHESSRAALSALNDLRSAARSDPEFCNLLVVEELFDDDGAFSVANVLGARGRVGTEGMKAILAGRPTTADMNKSVNEWLDSPSALSLLCWSGRVINHRGDAFLEWLSEANMASALRSEMMAKIELYIRSGFAQSDLSGEPPDVTDVLIGTAAAQALNAALDLLKHPKRTTAESLDLQLNWAIDDRIAELFMPLRVVEHDLQNGAHIPILIPVLSGAGIEQAPSAADLLIRDRCNRTGWYMGRETDRANGTSPDPRGLIHPMGLRHAMDVGLPPFDQGEKHRILEQVFFSSAPDRHTKMLEHGWTHLTRDERADVATTVGLFSMASWRGRGWGRLRDLIATTHRVYGAGLGSTTRLKLDGLTDENAARQVGAILIRVNELLCQRIKSSDLLADEDHNLLKSLAVSIGFGSYIVVMLGDPKICEQLSKALIDSSKVAAAHPGKLQHVSRELRSAALMLIYPEGDRSGPTDQPITAKDARAIRAKYSR